MRQFDFFTRLAPSGIAASSHSTPSFNVNSIRMENKEEVMEMLRSQSEELARLHQTIKHLVESQNKPESPRPGNCSASTRFDFPKKSFENYYY